MSDNAVADEQNPGLFVSSEIDDFGLDPYEFRIYARIVRRAGRSEAWESIPKMARACRMSESRARSALQLLQAAGFIENTERQGDTTIRRLTSKRYWAQPEQLNNIRNGLTRSKTKTATGTTNTPTRNNTSTKSDPGTKTATPSRSDTATHSKTSTGVVAELIPLPLAEVTDKGIPMKDIHLRKSHEEEAAATTSVHSYVSEDFFQPRPLETSPHDLKLLGEEKRPASRPPSRLLSESATEPPQLSDWSSSSSATPPQLQREIERMAFDWRSRPWMSSATEFQPVMKAAVWRSNPQEYSIAGSDIPNETYIINRLRKLERQLKNPREAHSAYEKLQTYWKTAIALTSPEVQSEFSTFKVKTKQVALAAQVRERQQHTLEAIKDLI